jgi:hypothetical protein
MSATRPSLDYLASCSEMSLESVELSRLNVAANLRKEFHEILEEWIDSEVDAQLARTLLEWRRAHDAGANPPCRSADKPAHFEQLAIAFLPETVAPAAQTLPERQADSSPSSALAVRTEPREVAPAASRTRQTNPGRAASGASPCARSNSLTKAAATYFGAVEKLVAGNSGRSRVRPKVDAYKLSDSQPVPRPDLSDKLQREFLNIAAPAPEVASRALALGPTRATGDGPAPRANADGEVLTPAPRNELRPAPLARVPFRGGPVRHDRAAAAS